MKLNTCAKPVWPKDEQSSAAAGTVNFKFLVDEEGKVIDSTVRTSSGSAARDEAARQAMVRCQFRPALLAGKPVRGWTVVKYTWTADKALSAGPADAVAKDDPETLFQLSRILRGGTSSQPDLEGAARALQKAAEKGRPEAMAVLARNYESGTDGFKSDLALARSWYLKAAQLGISEAQRRAGAMLLEGEGGSQDLAQGAAWLRKASDQGNAEAAYDLWLRLANGTGMARNWREAMRQLTIAAENKLPEAQYTLAVQLLHDDSDAVADIVRWLKAAAEDQMGEAELLLAELKLEGKIVPRDEAGGMALLRRSAEGGNAVAMAILGSLLTRGVHTTADATAGKMWSSKAAQYGEVGRPASTGYFAKAITADPGQRGTVLANH
ncbi:MAG: TonB family protein [Gammaproteobacteria bacterium]